MVFGAVRLAAVLNVDFNDFTFSAKTAHVWSVAEAGVAIIVSSSPLLRPIFDKVFGKFISLTGSGSRSRRDNNSGYVNSGNGPMLRSTPAKGLKGSRGFIEMDDTDLELRGMSHKPNAGQSVRIEGPRRKSDDVSGDDEMGSDYRQDDDSSAKAIYVTQTTAVERH